MTQHLSVRYAHGQHRTACGRWVQPGQATGVAGTTCRRCMATRAYEQIRDDMWTRQQARADERRELAERLER